MAYPQKGNPIQPLQQYAANNSDFGYDRTKNYGNDNAGKNLAVKFDTTGGTLSLTEDNHEVEGIAVTVDPSGDLTVQTHDRMIMLQGAVGGCTVGQGVVGALKGTDKGHIKTPAKPSLDPSSTGNPSDAELTAYSTAIEVYVRGQKWKVLKVFSNTAGGEVLVERQ